MFSALRKQLWPGNPGLPELAVTGLPDDEAREALLSTKNRPLVHRMRRDSKTIPGVIMADIWMRIRADLRERRA